MPWVWEWCKNVWYSNKLGGLIEDDTFENDVKMYGTQTASATMMNQFSFENDVKMYGTQTTQKVLDLQVRLRMM